MESIQQLVIKAKIKLLQDTCKHENSTIIVVEAFATHELIALKCHDCGKQSTPTTNLLTH